MLASSVPLWGYDHLDRGRILRFPGHMRLPRPRGKPRAHQADHLSLDPAFRFGESHRMDSGLSGSSDLVNRSIEPGPRRLRRVLVMSGLGWPRPEERSWLLEQLGKPDGEQRLWRNSLLFIAPVAIVISFSAYSIDFPGWHLLGLGLFICLAMVSKFGAPRTVAAFREEYDRDCPSDQD